MLNRSCSITGFDSDVNIDVNIDMVPTKYQVDQMSLDEFRKRLQESNERRKITIIEAAHSGNLDYLISLEKKGYHIIEPYNLDVIAAYNGHTNLLEWISQKKKLEHYLYEMAIRGKHIEIIKYLMNKNVERSQTAILAALQVQNYNLADWLFDNEFILTPYIFEYFCKTGDVSAIYWLLSHKCPVNLYVAQMCAKNDTVGSVIRSLRLS